MDRSTLLPFAVRTLVSSECNYGQIENMALALVFRVQQFHQYLYGHKFTLVTDHKPLMTILGPKKGIPSLVIAKLQRWAIQLPGYYYEIKFRSTHQHCNADALSRLPLDVKDSNNESEATFNIYQIETLPVTATEIQRATRHDQFSVRCFTSHEMVGQSMCLDS